MVETPGWGAVPAIFDEARPEWQPEREQLRELLDPAAYTAARRTTINAHYEFTDRPFKRRRISVDTPHAPFKQWNQRISH